MAEELEESLWKRLEGLLPRVQRPSRYIGGEWNSHVIEPGGIRVALAYPDVYEIGISNIGLSILYEVINGMDGACCERVYSPWLDMEEEMRKAGIPLFTLETHRPVKDFDIFGISIPHELTYTNILNLIDLAGVPVRSTDRNEGPLIVGGGGGSSNPEPLAEFFDLFILGEAEEALSSLVELTATVKGEGRGKQKILDEAVNINGVYRPDGYRVEYDGDGLVRSIMPGGSVPDRAQKAIVDMDGWCLPQRPLVPFCEPVHDRINIELFRGCTRGCRFCQAGMIYRPVRERTPGNVVKMVSDLAGKTGHDSLSLCSLSSVDYTRFEDVVSKVAEFCEYWDMDLSFPSIRMDASSVEMVSKVNKGGRMGSTFAPEAGSERLRKAINKPISEREMVEAIVHGMNAGNKRFKLYFMIGLPTETEEDVKEISRLVFKLRDQVKSRGLPPPGFNISVSVFVPKPHTPFQWSPQDTLEAIQRKQEILKSTLRARGIKLSWHDSEASIVEGMLARGDRRFGKIVERAWKAGERFDNWSECFDYSRWEESWKEEGLDPLPLIHRERGKEEIFPWDHLDYGLDKSFLHDEYMKSKAGETTPDCRSDECSNCGVCSDLNTKVILKGKWGS
ncbi:MAG: TIGR03960 family B12-binding radical SAM protein [Actinobacteria bacterium]|nr:TIGR03960 family B12-binding radical SAM protein [Actinomycetota bacterium]